jgi:acetylornithine deacetylase/succinyl-diaminopimelate desuccinylase-like protein
MSRAAAIARAHAYFDRGEFLADLKRRVAIPSSSQEPERKTELRRYLDHEIVPALEALGFASRILEDSHRPPILLADRMEGADVPTILIYGHGDTIRDMDESWRTGLSPWTLTTEGRSFLRPWDRRQQRTAQHQYRRACGGD